MMDRASRARATWGESIPADAWNVYGGVIDELQRAAIPFALGGAFALATYTGHWRDTKDLDFYILHEDCPRVVDILFKRGLEDYYDTLAYDRGWIFRAFRGETIVDAIWGMPNRRATVTREWVTKGPVIELRDKRVHVLPPEELIFAKIFVMQRPRCDWPDLINVIYGAGDRLDFRRLVDKLGDDVPLLRSVLSTFAWVAPGRACELPAEVWTLTQLPQPENGPRYDERRVNLLDTRPWFAPMMLRDQ
jgi:hypothetical protein